MLALPPRIVHKPGPLEVDEWELMRRHPLLGLEFLRDERVGPRPRRSCAATTSAGTGTATPTA